MDKVAEMRPGARTIPERSPVGSSGSNGVVERAVQEIEGRIRALKLSLEHRIGKKVDAKERIVAFMPNYAAYLYNRLHKGDDGKVAYERIKGKRPTVIGVEFGEKVLYTKHRGSHLEKTNSRFSPGIMVGVNRRSNEFLVMNKEGLHKTRTIKRIVDKWSEDNFGNGKVGSMERKWSG